MSAKITYFIRYNVTPFDKDFIKEAEDIERQQAAQAAANQAAAAQAAASQQQAAAAAGQPDYSAQWAEYYR